jgi:hypothetical protein
MMLEGSCHCGNVTWKYEIPLESVTACNCTVCRRFGALWAYGYLGEGISISGPTGFYSRGEAIEFHFCKNCSCVTHYTGKRKDENGRMKVAVNTRMVSDPKLIESLPIDHFEGLVTFEDLPRDHRTVKDLWF